MKRRVGVSQVIKYSPLFFRREDLDDVSQLISTNSQGVKFSTREYEFDNTDELFEHYSNKPIKQLRIATKDGSTIIIELNQWYAELSCRSEDMCIIGLFHSLDLRIKQTRRKPAWIYSYYTYWAYIIGSIGLSTMLDYLNYSSGLVSAIDGIIFLILTTVLFRIRMGRHVVIRINDSKSSAKDLLEKWVLPIVFSIIATIIYNYFQSFNFSS